MQSAKETASNAAASAKAGMDKTKAIMQEKAEKMTTRDPLQKEMATDKKEERIHDAELRKQEARHQNAGGGAFGHDYTTGAEREARQDYPQGLSGGGQDPNAGGARNII